MKTTVHLSFDLDALSSWITSFKQTSPTPISRGEFGARVGVPRVLDLLHRLQVPATFFVPGHTALTFPEAVRAIAAEGHEIAAHSFLHASPVGMSREQELNDFIAAEEALKQVAKVKPIGYRSPAWDLSVNTLSILAERGYLYDSSLMADDYRLYRPRINDEVQSDGRVVFGPNSSLVEFPVAWELDDFVYFQFMGKPPLNGLRSAEEVGAIWWAEFDYCAKHVEGGTFTLTMHPEVIGRGPRIVMLERLIQRMKAIPGVQFSRMSETAERYNQSMPMA
ncbi:polysaccharide deacetylase [Paraburkholderia sp. BL27I4N3]|uniref:polysaccharide deacetylase family protein n=1 Tax=Paraburkholderia sp. BL27I4N3 TaxID=1938805 RepID=UPI000E224C98|nr:polysaccharide deacetylase [Paraburkholderia sp. BL27I4N3]REE07481.1 polysaccharide deacetylase [Paraburkholderia sp. BL27I4N3]